MVGVILYLFFLLVGVKVCVVFSVGARGGAGGAAARSMSESARPTEVTRPSPLPDLLPSSSTALLSYFLLSSVVEPIHFDPAEASATDL